jgi:hypothetical protein
MGKKYVSRTFYIRKEQLSKLQALSNRTKIALNVLLREAIDYFLSDFDAPTLKKVNEKDE